MKKLFSCLITLSSLTLVAQPTTAQLDYDFYSYTPSCCYGHMLGYTVRVADTINGQAESRFDSVRYSYDAQSRIKQIEVFRQPHQDSILALDEWVRAAFTPSSNMAHQTTFGQGVNNPDQPVDSIHYEYDFYDELQTEWQFEFDNGTWENTTRINYFRWPGIGDTGALAETFENGLWKPNSYRQRTFNADSLLTEEIIYLYENGQKEPLSKYTLAYDGNGFMDSLILYFYDPGSQAFLPEFIDYYKYNEEGLLMEFGAHYKDFISQELYWALKETYQYEDGKRTIQHTYDGEPNTDTLRYVAFTRFQHNEQGKINREKHFNILANGDTAPGNLYQHFFHFNGYPDSSHLYRRNLNGSDIVKYYYSTISGIEPRHKPAPAISIYPNPTEDRMFLRLEATPRNDIQYHIISIDGKVVDRGRLSNRQQQYQLPVPQAKGTYLYHFNIDGRPVTKKVLKK